MPSIIIRRDGKPTKEVELEKEFTLIGQAANADIHIEDADAIEERASILHIGHDFILNELGLASGTLVNGHPVKKHVLKDRDLITIGEYRMTFQDKRDKPVGIEEEVAEMQSPEAMPRHAEKFVDPLLAPPNKKTELVTYIVIAVAAIGMSYWGYQSYVEREAREAQVAEAQAALAKANQEAKRKEAEGPRDITQEVMSSMKQTEPAPQKTPDAGQSGQGGK